MPPPIHCVDRFLFPERGTCVDILITGVKIAGTAESVRSNSRCIEHDFSRCNDETGPTYCDVADGVIWPRRHRSNVDDALLLHYMQLHCTLGSCTHTHTLTHKCIHMTELCYKILLSFWINWITSWLCCSWTLSRWSANSHCCIVLYYIF